MCATGPPPPPTPPCALGPGQHQPSSCTTSKDRQLQRAAGRHCTQHSHRFFACEPHRGWLALAGSHLVGALGANAVTRHDAVASVHAGFRGSEIGAFWPAATATWQCHEARAGLFSAMSFSACNARAATRDCHGATNPL
jgi:hypothetical protein